MTDPGRFDRVRVDRLALLPLQLAFQEHCVQEDGQVPRQVVPIGGMMSSFRGEIG